SVGTLKSTRTNTRFPRTSRSRRESFAIAQLKTIMSRSMSTIRSHLFCQHLHQFHAAIAVAPLVVVPTDYFHETVSKHERQLAVENTGVGISDDVFGNQRFITVFDHAFVGLVRCRFLEC